MNLSRVLFIGAHTDDIELFAGGLLSKVGREGIGYCLTFSAHRGVQPDDKVRMAQEEFRSNMRLTGSFFELKDMNACDGSFQTYRDDIYQIVLETIKDFKPTLVVTHQPNDTNQDHQQVYDEVLRVTKGTVSLICGEYPFNVNEKEVKTNITFQIEEEDLRTKIEMIQNYVSQYAPHRKYFDADFWRSLATVRGTLALPRGESSVGALLGESFSVVHLYVPSM